MTIFVYGLSDLASELFPSATGIAFGADDGVEGDAEPARAHHDLSLFGRSEGPGQARADAFFGASAAEADGLRPGDLTIADSLEWQLYADEFFD